MVSIGAVALLRSRMPPEVEPRAVHPAPARVDRSTPAAAAESFLDAWRKRDHATAEALSAGEARAEVEARREREPAESTPEAELRGRVWNALAADRLAYAVEETTERSPTEVTLRGVASGIFMNARYERRIEFDLTRTDAGWTVTAMRLGDVLSDTPDFLELPGESGR